MKKFVIKISLAFVIISVVLLILLGLRSRDSFVPSYRFVESAWATSPSYENLMFLKTGRMGKSFAHADRLLFHLSSRMI